MEAADATPFITGRVRGDNTVDKPPQPFTSSPSIIDKVMLKSTIRKVSRLRIPPWKTTRTSISQPDSQKGQLEP